MSCEEEMIADDLSREFKKNRGNNSDVVEEIFNDSDGADDPTGLEGAAFQSRLPYDKMTPLEAQLFPGKLSDRSIDFG